MKFFQEIQRKPKEGMYPDDIDEQGMSEGKADYNFDIEDLKRLEHIRDLPTLKTQALALISKPSTKPMRPEKVEWFKNVLERMNSPLKVIKLMYDLLLSGEGHAVLGSKSSMNPNSYRQRFGEQDMSEGAESSPVLGAIIHRIMVGRTDLLAKYGPERIMTAAEDVADFAGDVEEIGSSDVSGWVKQVERMLEENPPEAFGEGWQEDSQDLEDWTKEVSKKLYRAHENQRHALARQLSKVEQKHFGSELTNGPLTNIVFSTLQALSKGQMVHYDPQSVGQMPFGSMVGDDARIIAAAGVSSDELVGYRMLSDKGIVDNIKQFLQLRRVVGNKNWPTEYLEKFEGNPGALWLQFVEDLGWSKDDVREAVQAKTDDKLLAYYAQRKAEAEKKEQGVKEAAPKRPVAPDPQNYDSDWDYYNDRDEDEEEMKDDVDYENMIDEVDRRGFLKGMGVAEASNTMQRYGQLILKRAKAKREAEARERAEQEKAEQEKANKEKKPGVAEGNDGYDDESTRDEYMNLQSGDYVRDSQDSSGEVFIMRGQPDDRRVRIEDKDGRGWNIAPYRLVAVDPDDAAIGHYFNSVAEAAQGHTIEAHGVRGMDRRTWHKTFRNTDQMIAWAEKHDAEIVGTRDLEQARHHNLSPAKQGVAEASLAQMRDYFSQTDSNTVAVDTEYGAPERKQRANVPPEIQTLINKMYRVGKITPQEFEILKRFQAKTGMNVGIKEADMTTGNQGYDSMLAVMKAVDAGQDATFNLGGEPVTLEYPEARFLAGKYKAFLKAGRQEEFLKYMENPMAFDRLMKQLRDLIDKQKNFKGSVPGERGVEEGTMNKVSVPAALKMLKKARAYLDQFDPEDDDDYFDAYETIAAEFDMESNDSSIDPLTDLLDMYEVNPQQAAQVLADHLQSKSNDVAEDARTFAPLSKDQYLAQKKALQDIQLDPETAKDPELRKELMIRTGALRKQAIASGHIAESLPKTNEGYYWCSLDKKSKLIPEGYKKIASGYITRK
jgi:hypothetical protein